MIVWHYLFWIAVGYLTYVHLVYPTSMVLVSLLPRSTSNDVGEQADKLPFVSLIIPAHNEESVLAAKLNNALEMDYPRERLEIIVASDGSRDRTVQIARSVPTETVRVLDFQDRKGKASVMNEAVAVARGEVLCFSDANVMFRPDAVRKLVGRLADESVAAVSGDVQLQSEESSFGKGESLYYRIERAIQAGESQVGSMIGVDGGMYIVRRAQFQPLPVDTILDDFLVTMQVIQQRRRVVYECRAIATENGTPTARDEYRRRVRVLAGAVQSVKRGNWPPLSRPVELWQYVSHKLLRWLGPLVLAILLISNAILWESGRVYQLSLAFQGGLWLLAAAAAVSRPFRGTWLGGVPFYFALSHAAMWVGMLKGLLNTQPVTWRRTARGSGRAGGDSPLEMHGVTLKEGTRPTV